MEIGNLHGNWYPNKQPRGLLFLGYPLEIKDANGQFSFSAGISWLVMFDTTGGYAGLWLILAFINITMFIIVLSLIVIDYLVTFVEYTGIFVINCYPYHIYSKVSEVSACAQCFVASQPSGRHVKWRAVATGPRGRSAQGTIGGNHKGLLGVPLPSLQPGAMDGRFHQHGWWFHGNS